MKILRIILSIYIIALSCMPCADAAYGIEEKNHIVQSDENSASDHHLEDNCSPFCVCSCCHCMGLYKFNDFTKDLLTINLFVERNTVAYTTTLFSNFQNAIWQPPQLS
ncbi:DUF6660 family protein [Flavobacterium sp. UMI-01]|uniref:DUF6660 family protein n=1 Tax=Flavobacterium sp. UMI-01 TaxID=1441053 RepID=UPI001C7E0168|nr:DUF6660 family protein [Flavobacterium sp. UMI-01]